MTAALLARAAQMLNHFADDLDEPASDQEAARGLALEIEAKIEALAASEARERELREALRWRQIAKDPPPPETDVLLYDPDADWWPIVGFLDDEGCWVHSAKEQTIFPTQWRPIGPLPDAPAPETGPSA